jgi:hypothetical protein
MTYRNDVDALEARKAALEFEVAAKTKERDAAARLLDEAQARAKLPILDNIRVASPCSVDWNSMTGTDRARSCDTCKKTVFNLSMMTRDEAETLLRDSTGGLCARYYQRHDGTILTADCTVGKRQHRKRQLIAASAVALLGGGVAAYLVARHERTEQLVQIDEDRGQALMGEISRTEPPVVIPEGSK